MNSIQRKSMRILAFIVFPLFVLGCSPKESGLTKATEGLQLSLGAILKSDQGNYKVYDYKSGEYTLSDSDELVLAYDKSSSSYILVENGKHYVSHNGQKFEIKDEDYSSIKLSPNANYISYFVEDEGLKLKLFETKNNKEIQFKSNVSISGTLYDWYDKDTIVYYGVSNDGTNGLFTYNIKENDEQLLYKIDEGYLAYIKGTIDNVIFLQLTLENNKELMIIDKNTKNVKNLTDKIESISDVIIKDNDVYFTGKADGNSESIYKLENDKPKRLIFDFPTIVRIEKGLKLAENGEILFIGSNQSDLNKQEVYSYSEDGTISVLSKGATDYVFLDYRN